MYYSVSASNAKKEKPEVKRQARVKSYFDKMAINHRSETLRHMFICFVILNVLEVVKKQLKRLKIFNTTAKLSNCLAPKAF